VFVDPGTGSPYELFNHTLMIILILLPALWTLAIMTTALIRYWRDTHGPFKDLLNYSAWESTLEQAAKMRHQTGGAEGCTYEENEPSGKRRRLHHLVMYGFILTFISTTSAAFMENVLGQFPPYDY